MLRLLSQYRGLNIRLSSSAVFDQAVVGGTTLLTMMFVGRLCGSAELGLFALAMANWYLVRAFLESLITSPFTVFVHRLDDEKHTTYAGSAIAHVMALAAAATTLLALEATLLYWIDYSRLAVVIAALAVTVPFRLLRQFARRFHYASLNLKKAVVLDVSVAVLQLFALAGIWWFDFLTAGCTLLAIGFAYALVLFFWMVRQRSSFWIRRERIYVDFLKNWALGRWLAASQISMMAAVQLLPWIIAFELNESQTGVFSACTTLVCIGAPLLVAVQNVLGPRSASVFSESGLAGLQHVINQTTLGVVLLMASFATLLAIRGDLLLRLLFGAEFGGYQAVVGLLAMTELAYASMLGAASGLTVLERSDLLFRSQLIGVLVTLALAIVLIGEYGLPGAAVAQLAGAAIGSGIAIYYYRRVVRELQNDQQLRLSEQAIDDSLNGSSVGTLAFDQTPSESQVRLSGRVV